MSRIRMHIFIDGTRLSVMCITLLIVASANAAINIGVDEEARLPYWEIAEPGVSIRLVQRLPDQTRGFFQARGFSVEDSEVIAQSCVFQTVFKNISSASAPSTIEYNLREWTVHADGARHGLKTREDWEKECTTRQTPPSARVAFEWSLLPTRQSYRTGDYNWGMSVFSLKPGDEFDLDVVWHQDGKKRSVPLKGVRCAPDIHLKPGDL